MFTLPQPESNSTSQLPESSTSTDDVLEGLPVVAMPETRPVLEAILTLCHPGRRLSDDVNIRNLTDALALVVALRKYEMHAALSAFRETLKEMYLKNTDDSIACFCLAWRYGLVDEVRMAARRLLPISVEKRPALVPAMKEISAFDFYKLQQHHLKCWAAVDRTIENSKWRVSSDRAVCWLTCRTCPPAPAGVDATYDRGYYGALRSWFHTLTNEIEGVLRTRQPLHTIRDPMFIAKALVVINMEDGSEKSSEGIVSARCPCRRQAPQHLRVFIDNFIRDIENKFQEVEDELFADLL